MTGAVVTYAGAGIIAGGGPVGWVGGGIVVVVGGTISLIGAGAMYQGYYVIFEGDTEVEFSTSSNYLEIETKCLNY